MMWLFIFLSDWAMCPHGMLINQIPNPNGTKDICDCSELLCPTPAPTPAPADCSQWISESVRLQHELSNAKDAIKRRDQKIKQCKKW